MLPSIFGENLFDDFFTDPFSMIPSGRDVLYGKHGKNLMKTDVRETDNSYELDVDLPGFKKDEINVEIADGYLTIQASKGLDKDQQDKEDVPAEDISAKYEDGILRLSVPKADQKELPKTSTIAIE